MDARSYLQHTPVALTRQSLSLSIDEHHLHQEVTLRGGFHLRGRSQVLGIDASPALPRAQLLDAEFQGGCIVRYLYALADIAEGRAVCLQRYLTSSLLERDLGVTSLLKHILVAEQERIDGIGRDDW